ncbi:hypothetical protein [Pseudonocardia spinosispora]|uniref:hypothetical protein n=1 Tax=Pseudonocardia spinosispora TaxID=103441 RepID=UPI00040D821E|nr:hypothetical protein [Pseudonocardia spinosispora]
MRIGITGHHDLTPGTATLVAEALRTVLAGIRRPIVGVTCLARGAEEVFARVVVELGGEIEVVGNEALLTGVDAIVAVWDGRSSPDPSGTGDMVAAARGRGLLVAVVWPAGAARG